MNDVINGLSNWRKNRNMDNKEFVLDVEVSNLLEECSEFLRADTDYDRIDALCDISVFSINAMKYLEKIVLEEITSYSNSSIGGIITNISNMFSKHLYSYEDSLVRIIKHSMGCVENLGYDYKKCMLETIKEISSREQCPIQAKEWKENGISGKWQKNKNQDKSTLYKANYESCKL